MKTLELYQILLCLLDQIISIAPVAFEESPLNLTFEAVPGELSLEDNTTVSVDEEDITQAVIQKVKVFDMNCCGVRR